MSRHGTVPAEPIDASGCELTLFTQQGCAESAAVRAWLEEQQISFTERDVSRDPEAAASLAATGVFATPLLVICGDPVLGHRIARIVATIERCPVRLEHRSHADQAPRSRRGD